MQFDNEENKNIIAEYCQDKNDFHELNNRKKKYQRYYEKQRKDFMIQELRNIHLNDRIQYFSDRISEKQKLYNDIVESKNSVVLKNNNELEKKRIASQMETKEHCEKLVKAYINYSSQTLKRDIKNRLEDKVRIQEKLVTVGQELERMRLWKNEIRTESLEDWTSVFQQTDLQAHRLNKMTLEQDNKNIMNMIDKYKKKIEILKKTI